LFAHNWFGTLTLIAKSAPSYSLGAPGTYNNSNEGDRLMRTNPFCRAVACFSAAMFMCVVALQASAATAVSGALHADQLGPQISRYLFGQFAEHLGYGIYGGIWVGEDSKIPNVHGYRSDVVAALKELGVPVVRWPGGCFADEYHWREGIGPRDKRPVRVNTHWGGVEESNAFGTHEFFDFAELIGADAYLAGNVGDASPDELAQWVEYITSDTKSALASERRANGRDKPWKLPFIGIGNELWGCGGNMRAEYAADLYRRYQTFAKVPDRQKIAKIAPGANVDDYHWTEVMMKEAAPLLSGVSLHYYTSAGPNWQTKRSSTDFGEDQWIEVLSKALYMDELITKHSAIMDKYDPTRKVGLMVDEWGTWYQGLPGVNPGFLHQQNSLRDALAAAVHLNLFSQHAERVKMANIAQMVNVLQAMILTQGDKMVLTPTYHVFAMYKPFKDATHLPLEIAAPTYSHAGYTVPAVQAAAARDTAGTVHVALVNLDPHNAARVVITIAGVKARAADGQILTARAINTINTFEQPDAVRPAPFSGASIADNLLTVDLPAKAVVMVNLK
jgi:alpha-L-arabinofuranosidase